MTRDDIKVSPARVLTVLGILGGLVTLWLFVTGALDRNYVSRADWRVFLVQDSAWKAQVWRMVDRVDARMEIVYCEGQPPGCRERIRERPLP